MDRDEAEAMLARCDAPDHAIGQSVRNGTRSDFENADLEFALAREAIIDRLSQRNALGAEMSEPVGWMVEMLDVEGNSMTEFQPRDREKYRGKGDIVLRTSSLGDAVLAQNGEVEP
jgi:hypothetical protein